MTTTATTGKFRLEYIDNIWYLNYIQYSTYFFRSDPELLDDKVVSSIYCLELWRVLVTTVNKK